MPNCTSDELDFGRLGRQVICADFDGGDISTEGGVMLLRQVDSKIGFLPTPPCLANTAAEQ